MTSPRLFLAHFPSFLKKFPVPIPSSVAFCLHFAVFASISQQHFVPACFQLFPTIFHPFSIFYPHPKDHLYSIHTLVTCFTMISKSFSPFCSIFLCFIYFLRLFQYNQNCFNRFKSLPYINTTMNIFSSTIRVACKYIYISLLIQELNKYKFHIGHHHSIKFITSLISCTSTDAPLFGISPAHLNLHCPPFTFSQKLYPQQLNTITNPLCYSQTTLFYFNPPILNIYTQQALYMT